MFASSLGTDKIDSLDEHITTLHPSGSSGLVGSEANLSFSNVGSATDSLSTFCKLSLALSEELYSDLPHPAFTAVFRCTKTTFCWFQKKHYDKLDHFHRDRSLKCLARQRTHRALNYHMKMAQPPQQLR
jgi:hypothetical protein